MQYKESVSTAEWSHYLKQSYEDVESILSSTRPVGQQFYQGQPVWNKRMLKEEEVLGELHNNSIFTTTCSYMEDFVTSSPTNDAILRSMLEWFWDVCNQCESESGARISRVVESEERRILVLREMLFYTSYRFNGVTDSHSNTDLVERNDLVLDALARLSTAGLLFAAQSRVDAMYGRVASRLLKENALGPIVLITPELGKWSTVGGLGVMVDNLSKALAKQGQEVIVISPYYDRDRYGNTE